MANFTKDEKMNSTVISFKSCRWDRKLVALFESCRMNVKLSFYVYKIISKSFIEKSLSVTSWANSTWNSRSSHRGVCKTGFLKKFAKFTRKHLCQILFFNKAV